MTEITFIIVKIDYDPVLYPNHAYGLIGTWYRAQTFKGIWISKLKVCIDLFKDPQLVFQSSIKKNNRITNCNSMRETFSRILYSDEVGVKKGFTGCIVEVIFSLIKN